MSIQLQTLSKPEVNCRAGLLSPYFSFAGNIPGMRRIVMEKTERVLFQDEAEARWCLLCLLLDRVQGFQPKALIDLRQAVRIASDRKARDDLCQAYQQFNAEGSTYAILAGIREELGGFGRDAVIKKWGYLPEFKQPDVAMSALRQAERVYRYVYHEPIAKEAFGAFSALDPTKIYYDSVSRAFIQNLFNIGGGKYVAYLEAVRLLVAAHMIARRLFERMVDIVRDQPHLIDGFGGAEGLIRSLFCQTEPYLYFSREMGIRIAKKERQLFGENELPPQLWRMFLFMRSSVIPKGFRPDMRKDLLNFLVAEEFERVRLEIEDIEARYPGVWPRHYIEELALVPKDVRAIYMEEEARKVFKEKERKEFLLPAREIIRSERGWESHWEEIQKDDESRRLERDLEPARVSRRDLSLWEIKKQEEATQWKRFIREVEPFLGRTLQSRRGRDEGMDLRIWIRFSGPYNGTVGGRRFCALLTTRAFGLLDAPLEDLTIANAKLFLASRSRLQELVQKQQDKEVKLFSVPIDLVLKLIKEWEFEPME